MFRARVWAASRLNQLEPCHWDHPASLTRTSTSVHLFQLCVGCRLLRKQTDIITSSCKTQQFLKTANLRWTLSCHAGVQNPLSPWIWPANIDGVSGLYGGRKMVSEWQWDMEASLQSERGKSWRVLMSFNWENILKNTLMTPIILLTYL